MTVKLSKNIAMHIKNLNAFYYILHRLKGDPRIALFTMLGSVIADTKTIYIFRRWVLVIVNPELWVSVDSLGIRYILVFAQAIYWHP